MGRGAGVLGVRVPRLVQRHGAADDHVFDGRVLHALPGRPVRDDEGGGQRRYEFLVAGRGILGRERLGDPVSRALLLVRQPHRAEGFRLGA